MLAASRGIAESIPGTGVTVNAVLPGPRLREGVSAFVESLAKDRGVSVKEMEAEVIKTVRPSSLIKRWATPEEVANPVVYICSEAASATTGAALRVDGGVVRSIAYPIGPRQGTVASLIVTPARRRPASC